MRAAEIYAAGYLAGLASLSEGRVCMEPVMVDGQATNELWVRFAELESRYRVTVVLDPEEPS